MNYDAREHRLDALTAALAEANRLSGEAASLRQRVETLESALRRILERGFSVEAEAQARAALETKP